MDANTPAELNIWCADPLPLAVVQSLERLRHLPGAVRIAAMPDIHLSQEVCVGTALGTRGWIYPAAIGGDIGCGVAALAFAGEAEALRGAGVGARILDLLGRWVPALKHAEARPLPQILEDLPLSHPALETLRRREAPHQLGTLGRGNHFLELQANPRGQLWLMVHTGSRGIGPALQAHHARHLGGGGALGALATESPEAGAYLGDLDWALAFAEASRREIVAAVAAILRRVLGVEPLPETFRDCTHNHVRAEAGALWVHRKGAIPAHGGEAGIIPGSMGSPSYLVRGRGLPEALWSSAHGAGRRMSRTEARQRIGVGALRRQLGDVLYDEAQADALRDEAPGAYKNIGAVMRAQRALTRIESEHRPILSYKGR